MNATTSVSPAETGNMAAWLWNILDSLGNFLKHEPEICLFMAIAIGFYIGKKKIGPIQLGGVCGTLLAALLIGQSGVEVAAGVKTVFFAIFIFALGYAGGPQFFASLNAKGLRLGAFSLIEVFAVLGLTLAARAIFNFDPGTAAGLVAGSATESAIIGTASDAISRLPLSADVLKTYQGNVVTAYSLTYVFGLITIVIFSSQIAPLILRRSLREEAEKLWLSLGGTEPVDTLDSAQAQPEMQGRIYSVSLAIGKTVRDIDKLLHGASVESIFRRKKRIPAEPDTLLHKGDYVLVSGHKADLARAPSIIGEERVGPAGLNRVVETEDFLFTGKAGKRITMAHLAQLFRENDLNLHVHLAKVMRGGHSMPIAPRAFILAGDVISLYGGHADLEKAGALIGRRIRRGHVTNFVLLGLGVVAGILIGRIVIPLGGIKLSFGTGGGALITGLALGWLQNRHPVIRGIPPSSVELMKDFGLAAFVACIGLSSGKQALSLVTQYGPVLPLVGISIVLVPACLSLLVGHFIFKMDLPVLLGGIAGQQCSTPALSAVQSAAGNTTPLIGYTITYAISNVLLPLLGPIIVGLAA